MQTLQHHLSVSRIILILGQIIAAIGRTPRSTERANSFSIETSTRDPSALIAGEIKLALQ